MKVFLTGASGRIGTHIIPHLLARGHTVSGLVRSQSSADKITSLAPSGITAVSGSLSDRDLIREMSQSHDAVIHCAMDHGDMVNAVQTETELIDLFADALEGTNKPFLFSSATGFMEPGSDEHTVIKDKSPRSVNAQKVLDLKTRGIRSIVVRLAMNTHDSKSMHPFLGMLVDAGAEDKLGYIPYIGDNRWSACHSDDAGLLYVLAMEKAEPGSAVHAVSEFIPTKHIAQALSTQLGNDPKPGDAKNESQETLGKLGWLAWLLTVDQDVSTKWTRETFGWEPKGQGLIDEIEQGGKKYIAEGQKM